MSFTEANVALALKLGILVLPDDNQASWTLIDVGCGNGDSLQLWSNSTEFAGKFSKIVGVNSNSQEYLHCFRRFQYNNKIQLVFSDAVEYVQNTEVFKDQPNTALVCVDAVYHFSPSRIQFLREITYLRPKISRIALSDIVLSERWQRERGKMDFVTEFLRSAVLHFIARASGTPNANLHVGLRDIEKELVDMGWTVTCAETITPEVFVPFADYCTARNQSRSLMDKITWILLFSSLFMRFLKWSGAVDFVLYAAKR